MLAIETREKSDGMLSTELLNSYEAVLSRLLGTAICFLQAV